MTDVVYTPTEARQRLSILRDRAIAAGLGDVVRLVDYRLMISAIVEIEALEKALAAVPLDAAHADIVAQLDTPTETPAASIPAPRRPGIASPSNPPRPAPKPQRRFTGPDAMDLEIPV